MDLNKSGDMFLFLNDDNLDMNVVMHLAKELSSPSEISANLGDGNYFEEVISQYTNPEFYENFGMERTTFELLSRKLGDTETINDISMEKQILFILWLLTKSESFLVAGDRFDISPSSGHSIFKNIIQRINSLSEEYIVWPTRNKCIISSQMFKEKSGGISGVIGAVDGCHIPIKQPKETSVEFYNNKGFYSIILQGVCDENCMLTDVFIGSPGRMNDTRVFYTSPLYEKLTHKTNHIIDEDFHLVGDSAYPLTKFLLTPYRSKGRLSPNQRNFNEKLSRIRAIIRKAFAMLKTKFKRLEYLDGSDLELSNDVIFACCILHNFIIVTENALASQALNERHDVNNSIYYRLDDYNFSNVSLKNGKRKRDEIALSLSM